MAIIYKVFTLLRTNHKYIIALMKDSADDGCRQG